MRPSCGQAALGDVHVRHHFQARDDGRLQEAQLRRDRDFVQDAVDAVTNAQIVLERLDVDVGRALVNRFADDLVDELHDRRVGIVGVQVGARFDVLERFEGAVGLEDFVEGFRADAVERFHRAQDLRARHEDPLGGLVEQLRGELAPGRVKQIVGREDDGVLLDLDRQDMVLEDEPARQDEQSRALDALGVDRDDRDAEKIADRLEEKLFVHFPGVEDVGGPRAAVEIGGESDRFVSRRHAAGKQDVDE